MNGEDGTVVVLRRRAAEVGCGCHGWNAAEMVKLRWRCAHRREGADSWLLVRGGSSEGGGGLWTLLVRE